MLRIPLRPFVTPRELVRPVLWLITGQEFDEATNGLAPLSRDTYHADFDSYVQAWRVWRGQ